MSPVERDPGGKGGKGAPVPGSGPIFTYKRRRREGGEFSGIQGGGTGSEIAIHRNGAIESDKMSRILNNWRNILESLMQTKGVDNGGGKLCIQRALACDPFRIFNQPNICSVQTEESSRGRRNGEHAVSTGSNPTKRSLRSCNGSLGGLRGQIGVDTAKCQAALCDILISEKFALLCDLLCENFKSNRASSTVDLSIIFSNMKRGIYEQSTDCFDQDIQSVWKNFLRIGEEITDLASSLLAISRASYQRQVGKAPECVLVVGEQNRGVNNIFDSLQLGSGCVTNQQLSTKESVRDTKHMDSYATTIFPSRESDPSTRTAPSVPPCLKVSTCRQCGLEADGEKSLICDGCEAVHHVNCLKPPVQEIPKRTWYCAACSSSRVESDALTLTCDQQDHTHIECVVCERITRDSGTHSKMGEKSNMVPVPSSSRECSVSSMEVDESLEPSRTAVMHLCKQCGTCEDEDKRFLVCSHKHCLYKYYHIRCLKTTQLATKHQPPDRWYCPSCLCRGCLVDKDDDLICLCDACDGGYHIYCMNPPRTTVPKGTWYCFSCSMEKAKKGMRMYEQWVSQNHGKNDLKPDKLPEDERSSGEAIAVAANKRNR